MLADPLSRAIALAGSITALAEACGITQAAISKAKKIGRVSAELAIAIEHATHGQVPREELRPDIAWSRAKQVGQTVLVPMPRRRRNAGVESRP